jgi:O-glycosyl hydrolase
MEKSLFRFQHFLKNTSLLLASVAFTTAWAGELTLGDLKQEIKGWGHCPHNTGTEELKNALFRDLGTTVQRLSLSPTFASANGVNTDVARGIKNAVKTARVYGTHDYIVMPWTPPDYMKSGRTSFNPAYVNDFAEMFIHLLKDLNSNSASGDSIGLPTAFHIQNESDFSPDYWAGCNYSTSEELRTAYCNIIKRVKSRMIEEGLTNTQLLSPEGCDNWAIVRVLGNGQEPTRLRSDPALLDAIDSWATHMYNVGGQTIRVWNRAMEEFKEEGKDVWMTEVCSGYNSMMWSRSGATVDIDQSINAMRLIGICMNDMSVNYYCWWAGHRGGGYDAEALYGGYPTKRYYMFQKMWRTVRPGWHVVDVELSGENDMRVSCESLFDTWTDCWIDFYAFVSPQRDSTFVVCCNANDRTRSITINNILGDNAWAWVTDQNRNAQEMDIQSITGNTVTVSLPPWSVVEVLSKGEAVAANDPYGRIYERTAPNYRVRPDESGVLYTLDGRRISSKPLSPREILSRMATGVVLSKGIDAARPALVIIK